MPIVVDVDDYYEFFQRLRTHRDAVLDGDPWEGRGLT
jgi:hypothetical protein